MIILQHTWTHRNCDQVQTQHLYKIKPEKRKSQPQHGFGRSSWSTTPNWGAAGNSWLLEEEELAFLKVGGLWEVIHAPVDDPTPMYMQEAVRRSMGSFSKRACNTGQENGIESQGRIGGEGKAVPWIKVHYKYVWNSEMKKKKNACCGLISPQSTSLRQHKALVSIICRDFTAIRTMR